MSASPSRLRSLAAVAVLAALVAMAACTSDEPGAAPAGAPAEGGVATPAPTEARASTPTPTPTATATATEVRTSTPAPAATATMPGELKVAIDSDTSWQEVFDVLTATEQRCIREEYGDEAETLLASPVLAAGPLGAWEVAVFSCVAPRTAQDIFLSVLIAGIAATGQDIELGEEEWACLQGWVGGLDVAALVADSLEGDAFGEVYPDFVSCVPELFLAFALIGTSGVDLEDVPEDELACLREWASGVDRRTLIAGLFTEDLDATIQFVVQVSRGLLDCAPRLFVSGVMDEEVEFDAEAVDCLRELLADPDVFDWVEDDSLDERLPACLLGLPAWPTNVRYAVEGSTIRVTWDAADGADFYNVSHHDFVASLSASLEATRARRALGGAVAHPPPPPTYVRVAPTPRRGG